MASKKYKIHECFVKKENHGDYNAWGNYYVTQVISYNQNGKVNTRILAKFAKEPDAIQFCNLKNGELEKNE